MSNTNKKPEADIEIGRGNVFAQLGLQNPEERLRKARLMNVINDFISRRDLSRKDAANATGLNQADISRIQRGRGSRYSADALLNALARLGVEVEITQRGDSGEVLIDVRELT